MAVEAIAQLKERGMKTLLLAIVGMEPHGLEVMRNATSLGLTVREARLKPSSCDGYLAALEGQQAIEKENQQGDSALPKVKFGIGINTGPAVAGNVGSEGRSEYTIIGDTVNYHIGNAIGHKLFNKPKNRFFNKKNLLKAHEFYEKHGGKTIVNLPPRSREVP